MRRALAIVGVIAAATSASADELRPGTTARIAIGPPRAPDPMARVDAGRSGRVAKLPLEVALRQKAQVLASIDLPIAVETGGVVLAATSNAQLVAIDPEGKISVRAHLLAPAATGPVLTSRGDAVLVTKGGDVVAFDRRGRLVYRVALASRDLRAFPVAMADGGVVVAGGRMLVRLDPDGHVEARARLAEAPIFDLLARGDEVVAVTESGRVVRWTRPSEPKVVASLGGPPVAGASLSGNLLVTNDGQRLQMVDIESGASTATVLATTAFDGAPSIAGGTAWIVTIGGLALGFARDGRELVRAPLSAPTALPFRDASTATPPPMLVDDEGTVAFARPSGEVGILAKSGVHVAEARACGDPVDLAWSEGSLVVACRDGTIATYAPVGP